MVVEKATILRDIIFFIKNDLKSNITDPISSTRNPKSSFVMTSYSQRPTQYPIITIKIPNLTAPRAGMQTTSQDITITLEVRIWARNEIEKDEIYTDVFNRLANIQFTASTGSIANNLHDYNVLSTIEIDEEGQNGIKSRIMEVAYNFYNN